MPRPAGAEVIFFGIATADNHVRTPIDQTDDGVPIYDFPNDFGFIIVVEARAGTNGRPPGNCGLMGQLVCNDGLSSVQVISNHSLGNGSTAVCDVGPPPDLPIGGVPGIPSFTYDGSSATNNAITDFGCRFDLHTMTTFACTLDPLGNYSFVKGNTTLRQYCTSPVVGGELAFPSGLTRLKVRVEDATGTVGNTVEIAISVP
jgi:hypothetical protein